MHSTLMLAPDGLTYSVPNDCVELCWARGWRVPGTALMASVHSGHAFAAPEQDVPIYETGSFYRVHV